MLMTDSLQTVSQTSRPKGKGKRSKIILVPETISDLIPKYLTYLRVDYTLVSLLKNEMSTA
jgi:hypothetical protein